MNENEFATGSVPVMVAARIYGKDASWVRAGIISGWLPIGKATRNGQLVTKIEDMNSKYGRINFYISPKRSCTRRLVMCGKGRSANGNNNTSGAIRKESLLDREAPLLRA